MRQLTLEGPAECRWRDAADPVLQSPAQALVRPLAVACCDLDVWVSQGALPMAPGHALGHEGIAEVVEVGADVTGVHATWPDGVCTDTGLYLQPVELPLLAMYTRGVQFVTGRVNARKLIPEVIESLKTTAELGPVVERVVPWEDADTVWPAMTGKTVFTRSA